MQSDPSPRRKLAVCHEATTVGRPHRSLALLQGLQLHDLLEPDKYLWHVELARANLYVGQPKIAAETLAEALNMCPDCECYVGIRVMVLRYLGASQLAMDKPRDAAAIVNEALRYTPLLDADTIIALMYLFAEISSSLGHTDMRVKALATVCNIAAVKEPDLLKKASMARHLAEARRQLFIRPARRLRRKSHPENLSCR